jgi:arsenate reductase (glutaredoxin)
VRLEPQEKHNDPVMARGTSRTPHISPVSGVPSTPPSPPSPPSPPMNIYHLANCSTCQRILKEIPNVKKFTLREIKSEPITAKELDEMKKLAGSYEALFSKIAMKYRSMGLNEMTLTEKDYRKYILEEYTFLKRPTIVIGDKIFIGSAPKTVKAMLEAAGA